MVDERKQDPQQGEQRRELLKNIRRIEIATNRVVNESLAGAYTSMFKGRGMEFDRVRLYEPGDDIRSIDWNVTARAGAPYVKQFHEERELTVMILVDQSQSQNFGTRKQEKRQLAAELAAMFAFSAIRNNDKVGLMLFTDEVERLIVPQKGRRHVLRVIQEILSFQPEHTGTNLTAALDYLGRLNLRRSVVVLLSDFIAPDFEQSLRRINRKHDLVALSLHDRMEAQLPDLGLVPMEDAETGELRWVDTTSKRVREQWAAWWRERDEKLDRLFRRAKVDRVPIECGEDYIPKIVSFFRRRAKRVA